MDKKSEIVINAEETFDYIVEFKTPYIFEGTSYTSVDLSGLEDLTVEDLKGIEKRFSTEEYISPMPEASTTYCVMVAAKVTGRPEEFFNGLPIGKGLAIKNKVVAFFQKSA